IRLPRPVKFQLYSGNNTDSAGRRISLAGTVLAEKFSEVRASQCDGTRFTLELDCACPASRAANPAAGLELLSLRGPAFCHRKPHRMEPRRDDLVRRLREAEKVSAHETAAATEARRLGCIDG